MNLLLLGNFDDAERAEWLAALGAALPGHRLLTARDQAPADTITAAIVANPPPGSLQGLPALRLIQSLWAGVDRLLADATLPPGVPVARMVDPAMNAAMAETALWAVLALHRGFFRYQAQQRAGQWQAHGQRRADEVPVLVLGAGQMGGTTAARLAALGYPVTLWRRDAGPLRLPLAAGLPLLHGAAALQRALAGTQVLVNLLPLTPDTRGLVNAELLARQPRGAGLVNLARGAHVVDDELLAALDSGHLGHAVLDVFHTEPLPAGHRFWAHPQVSVLPHAAAATDARSAAAVVAHNIEALVSGAPLAHLVTPGAGY